MLSFYDSPSNCSPASSAGRPAFAVARPAQRHRPSSPPRVARPESQRARSAFYGRITGTGWTIEADKAPVMTEAMAGLTPFAFTRGLVAHLEHLSRVRATEAATAKAKKFLRERRDLRNEPSDRKGYEYVVEILLRRRITRYAEDVLHIPRGDSHRHIYSSHFHTTSDEPGLWRARWLEFRRAYPGVDTDDDGHSRRADLFISMRKTGLVSVEFKYLRAPSRRRIPSALCESRSGDK
jgi:hypothetical protein